MAVWLIYLFLLTQFHFIIISIHTVNIKVCDYFRQSFKSSPLTSSPFDVLRFCIGSQYTILNASLGITNHDHNETHMFLYMINCGRWQDKWICAKLVNARNSHDPVIQCVWYGLPARKNAKGSAWGFDLKLAVCIPCRWVFRFAGPTN